MLIGICIISAHIKNAFGDCSLIYIAVGACRADWSEVDPELMRDSVIYVDSKEAAMKEAGDIIISKVKVISVGIITGI